MNLFWIKMFFFKKKNKSINKESTFLKFLKKKKTQIV